MCDLLWSDPDDRVGWGISPRGAGYTYGHVSRRLPGRSRLGGPWGAASPAPERHERLA